MNDHIPDPTKMINDTPRTEAEVNRQKCWSDDLVTIDANFACQLERELNAANQRIKQLEEAKKTIKELEEVNEYLRQKNDKLEYGRTNK